MEAGGSSVEVIPVFRSDELENLHNEIGRGGMGVVSLYRWNVDEPKLKIRKGQRAAVKKLEYTSDIRSVKDEARILWPLHRGCPYILRMFGLMDTPDVRIVLDYMKHGNIAAFFATINTGIDITVELDHLWPLKTQIAQQVCEGMVYLHDRTRPILHCDLKAANILLDEKLDVKICDFGLAKLKRLTTRSKSDEQSKENAVNSPAGTVSHLAPELLSLPGRPTIKSDVYSFGILLWELLTDRRPYEGISHPVVVIKEVLKNKRPDLACLPVRHPKLLNKMMTDSWHQYPDERPDFSELRRRFKEVDDRRRFKKVDDSVVKHSVDFAGRIWKSVCEAETNPKQLLRSCTTRSANNPTDITNFETQEVHDEYARRPPAVPPVENDGQPTSCPDPSSAEIFISDSSAPSSAIQPTEHVTDPKEPLIGTERSPPRVIQRPALVNPKKCSCAKIAIPVVIMCGLCAAVGTFFVGRYVIPSYTKGCCLNCFDQADPGLHSSCDIPNGSSIAPTGSTCRFSCKDGYVLNGNVTELKCGDNGVWSGPFPYCRKIRQCPALRLPANGGSMHCTHSYYEGSKCSFSCPDGYILQLPGDKAESSESSDDFDVTCEPDKLMNYQWSGKEPYCEKVVSCDPPTKDPNVKSNCDSGDYINGTVCNFSCAEEMSLASNESTGLCQDNSKWNLTSDVSCIQATCASTPWKFAHVNDSAKEATNVAFHGLIHKLSPVKQSEETQHPYFAGELINECSTIPFVCFDERKYRLMKKFKDVAATVLLLNVDVRRNSKTQTKRVVINKKGSVAESNRTLPVELPEYRITPLRDVLELVEPFNEVNTRVRVIAKDPPKTIKIRGRMVDLYISYISDDTAEMPLRQWGEDILPANEGLELTNLVVKAFMGEKYLQTTTFTEIKV